MNAAAAGSILNLFIKHTMRWMNIDLQLAGPRLAMYPEAGKLVAPVLQRFRLRTSYRVYEKDERYIFGVFQDVPRLINLQVSRVPELDLLANSTVEVPWHQLDALSLDYVPSIGTSLHILTKCESVRECTLKVDTLFGPLLDEPLVHPYLHSLSINISNEHFTGFFSRITLPALKNLSIHVRGPLEQYRWPQSCFEEFLRRSSCKLTRLELRDSGMRADQFISTLQQPYLQTLHQLVVDDRRDWTWDPFVTDAGLYLMNCSLCMNASAALAVLDDDVAESESDGVTTNPLADQACFLPSLQALIVRGNCLQTADGTIADMVESRFYFREHGVAQLRRVELDLPSSHLADLQRLKAMQAEGLTVDLGFI
ncbi:hypothetical protein EST38_g832 [Candolleomyces aberdarensis]|uniref:F-box protein n=1 Tax=Candolleomyces aberdarensis TaxID=2316362 RepID=A0A4Q2DWK9_9AGAR|nr:hypothetical protein EST38_g832 [Candolleomyces aberdarensis]